MTLQVVLAIFLVMQLSMGMAAAPVIGVASAKGSFRIDNATVAGNGTLLEGTTIETNRASSDVDLVGGVKMALGAGSRGRVYRDHLVLEKGDSQLRNATRFGVEAKNLRVIADDANTVSRISVRDNNRVQVAALAGTVRVTNANGLLIASVAAGRALEFEQQAAGAAGPARLTGCLVKRDGHFFLTDDTANITVELKGAGLDSHAGHKIEIMGSQVPGATPEGNASQMIQVSAIKEISKRCSLPAGAVAGGAAAGGAAAGGAAGGAATAAGIGIAAKAVIAGVIVAAAGTSAAIAVTQSDDTPNISR